MDPAILREIVVIQANAGAEDGVGGAMRSVGKSEAGRNGFAIVVRHAGDERAAGGLERAHGGIRRLIAAGRYEEAEGGVVAQASVQSESRTDAPGILRVKAKAANALGKCAVAGAGCILSGAVGKIGIRRGRKRIWARGEHGGICDIEAGIAG